MANDAVTCMHNDMTTSSVHIKVSFAGLNLFDPFMRTWPGFGNQLQL